MSSTEANNIKRLYQSECSMLIGNGYGPLSNMETFIFGFKNNWPQFLQYLGIN